MVISIKTVNLDKGLEIMEEDINMAVLVELKESAEMIPIIMFIKKIVKEHRVVLVPLDQVLSKGILAHQEVLNSSYHLFQIRWLWEA